ncbi:MAG: Ig-like domain-containing protein, partial [Candidatus Dormibacteraeota bacterium]|nr:Ig-like domain-containing protein [Candidatus Dormibacteraeota bacterium]
MRLTLLLLLPATLALATPTQASAASPALGTVTSLSPAASPVGEGQPTVLTATVEGPGWPSGTVTFSDYELGPLASVALSQGQATASLPALPPGLHLISAEYSGDGTFAPSSARLTQRIGDTVSSRVELNVDHNPSRPGQAVTLTADLLSGAGFGAASGTVTVVDGTTQLGSLPVSLLVGPAAQGPVPDHLTLPVSSLAPGVHSLTAIYSGDGNLRGSTSTTWNQVVGERVATATTLASAANPFLGGQKAMLSAAVAPLTPASRQPSGSLTFRDGGSVLGKADLASGAGTLAVSLIAAGSHDLTVAYSGDSDFQESTSAPLALQVLGMTAGPSATYTTLTAGPDPLSFGQPLTLRASVAPVFGSRVPGGSVYFVDESGAVLGGIGLDPAGQGVLATSALTAGPHRLTAVYAGADGFS